MGQKAKAEAMEPGLVWTFQLRCSARYRKWLVTVSEETLIPMSAIARDAMARWAEARGLPAPPLS